MAKCTDCGKRFQRARDEQWKVRCFSCWLRRKEMTTAPEQTGAQAEFPEHLRELMQLCHPDKHGGSPLANDVTAWLLRVRRELRA